ncbi:MAG: flippase [Candidatus Hodarchaeota archaeon]
MNLIQLVFKNILSLTISKIFLRGIPALIAILVIRYLGKEQYGYYATAIAFTAIFSVFLEIGLGTGLVRMGSRDRNAIDWFYGNVLFLKALLGAIAYLFMLLIAFHLHYSPKTVHLIPILGLVVVITSFYRSFSSVMEVFQRMEVIALFEIASSAFPSLLVFIVIVLDLGLYAVGYAALIAALLVLIIWFWFTSKLATPRIRIHKLVYVLRNSWMFGLGAIFYVVFYEVDSVMLSIIKNETQVAIYSAAYKLMGIALVLQEIISRVVNPLAFNYGLYDRNKLRKIHVMVTRYYACIGTPIAVLLFCFSTTIINFLFGGDFSESVILLKLFSLVILIRYLSDFNGNILVYIDKVNVGLTIFGSTALLNVILNILLIPPYGYIGAAIATLVCETFLSVLRILSVFRLFMKINLQDIFARVLIPGSAMFLFLHFFRDDLTAYSAAIVAIALYVALLFLFKFFTYTDKLLLQQIVHRI